MSDHVVGEPGSAAEACARASSHALLDRVWAESWAVPEPTSVSEWAERRRVLDGDNSENSGPWSNELTPHLVGVMNAFREAHIRKISICKSSQGGGTEAIYNMIGYAADHAPGPALLVYPTLPEMKKVIELRFLPTLAALRPLEEGGVAGTAYEVIEARNEGDGGGKAGKKAAGGLVVKLPRMHVLCAGSNVDASLKSWPVKFLFEDELDEFKPGAEGLAQQRLQTFKESKDVACSTPTLTGKGIDKRYGQSDRRRFHVPCPECAKYQELQFERLWWRGGPAGLEKEGQPVDVTQRQVRESICYVCERCGCAIGPSKRRWMVQRGEWVKNGMSVHQERVDAEFAADPQLPMGAMFPLTPVPLLGRLDGPEDHAGFTWSQLISLFVEWHKIVWEWAHDHNGKPDPNWINQTLGRAFTPDGQHLEVKEIARHFVPIARGGYKTDEIPPWCVCLTAGIDVGDNDLWIEVRGWSPGGKQTGVIHCNRLGAPITDLSASLEAVNGIRQWTFPFSPEHPVWRWAGTDERRIARAEKGLPLAAAMVDSGDGDRTKEIYGWCLSAMTTPGCELLAGKGRPTLGHLAFRETDAFKDVAVEDKSAKVRLPLFLFSNLYYKSLLMGQFRQRPIGSSSLERAPGPESGVALYCWPQWEDDTWHGFYAKHLTSEHLVPVLTRHGTRMSWEKRTPGAQNHLFDAACMSIAAAEIVGVERMPVPAELLGQA